MHSGARLCRFALRRTGPIVYYCVKMTAEEYYQKGNEYRKQGLWHEAINCYIQAIELDPDSPAVEAKRMLDDIMAYYCKDMYNP